MSVPVRIIVALLALYLLVVVLTTMSVPTSGTGTGDIALIG